VTDHLEDLIRRAQERRAADIVDPDRIRRALPARAARRTRQVRLGGVTLAVALAATAAIPFFLGGTSPAQQSATPSATSSTATAQEDFNLALRYRPTWLPEGLTERTRRFDVGPTWVERVYTAVSVLPDGGGSDGLILDLRAAMDQNDPEANTGAPVDIGGKPGFYHGNGDGKSYVEWRIDDRTVASVRETRLGLGKDVLLRVARSVQPDPGSTLLRQLPVGANVFPRGMTLGIYEVFGDTPAGVTVRVGAKGDMPGAGEKPNASGRPAPSKATATATATPGGGANNENDPAKQEAEGRAAKMGPPAVSITLGPGTEAPTGGESLTVAGRPARTIVHTDEGAPGLPKMRYLVVDLGDGRLLTVLGMAGDEPGLPLEELTGIATRFMALSTDGSWIGTR